MAAMLRLTGLVISRLQAGKRKHLRRTLKLAYVAVLREDDCSGQLSDAGDSKDRRV